MNFQNLKPYKYNGARSMVIMHEQQMLSFLETWKEAKKINLPLPKTDDPSYKSLETLFSFMCSERRVDI